ncbi:NUDIX hydrolase [Marinactinospora thermotolerans]|uniref:ADP-ribose pyrophosphatase YjhB, NUDIX family n=2 Tax=Marinactinospora thermotolerans TaxID=531310 RepID=A0A1T4T4V5_9ACTN|nr:NUDIX domain-containing protein [Marinactinospora thermotolerans]AET51843.1 NTP-pyrophosphohydrolase [Marinactinospora thermotolerans]SKA35281.1 ADP-ribose pyrophosphatase YjhB, NUDIX family [Marinactinospora thermotolerans DSM 45154]
MSGPVVVGALIRDGRDRVFVQRRSESRSLFPGCWDIVGGAVEPGETLIEALRREILEETGWRLRRTLTCLGRREWEAEGVVHSEVDFVVDVIGDLDAPRLERDKHSCFAWLSPRDIAILDEDARRTGSDFIRNVVADAHRWLRETSSG